MAWNLLPAYYKWLADKEEHYDALHAFHVILRTADLSSAIYRAVAQTGVDRESLPILHERSGLGDQHAHSVLQSSLKLLGTSALQSPAEVEREEPQSAVIHRGTDGATSSGRFRSKPTQRLPLRTLRPTRCLS